LRSSSASALSALRGSRTKYSSFEEDRGDVVVTRDEPDRSLAVDAGLADNRVVLAHLREDAGRIRAQLGAIEVVLALRRGHRD
jgi:hypothetical protein